MVQKNLTVWGLRNQRLLLFQSNGATSVRETSGWQVTQSDQPITAELREATALQGTLVLMQTVWCDPMVVPDRQQSEHAGRERAMHRRVGSQNTVPIFHHAAGSHCSVPRPQQLPSTEPPIVRQVRDQLLRTWS